MLSIENYSFSMDELINNTDSSRFLKSELTRLIEKKEIVSVRKGFYLIIPPRYSKQGSLPIQLYIDKLFKYLNRNYYIGFYSAAKFHGASHQQTHKEYVMTETPKLNDIKKKELNIRFLTTTKWALKNIIEKKSDAGIFKLSSPALTVVDLINHQTKVGGINRMLAILEELSEEITEQDLKDLLSWYPYMSTLQRFGFLLEELKVNANYCNQIKNYLDQSKIYPVLLSPRKGESPGAVDNQWKVDVNIKLESDL